MSKKKQPTKKTDATIVAMLLSGSYKSQQEIADETGVSNTYISNLKRAIPKELQEEFEQIKTDKFADLVSQNLEAMLESNIRIADLTKNDLWMEKQSAAEIATLLGVQSDKVFRILAAIEVANNPAGQVEN